MDIYNDDYIVAEGEKNGVFKESLDKERMIGRKQRETSGRDQGRREDDVRN